MTTDYFSTSPTILDLKRKDGIAGQIAYMALIQYPDEIESRQVQFIGSTYGNPGPVVMVTAANLDGHAVTEPSRFGDSLNAEWVERFFA